LKRARAGGAPSDVGPHGLAFSAVDSEVKIEQLDADASVTAKLHKQDVNTYMFC
jgi:hypothetical protein